MDRRPDAPTIAKIILVAQFQVGCHHPVAVLVPGGGVCAGGATDFFAFSTGGVEGEGVALDLIEFLIPVVGGAGSACVGPNESVVVGAVRRACIRPDTWYGSVARLVERGNDEVAHAATKVDRADVAPGEASSEDPAPLRRHRDRQDVFS